MRHRIAEALKRKMARWGGGKGGLRISGLRVTFDIRGIDPWTINDLGSGFWQEQAYGIPAFDVLRLWGDRR